jgi:hypothetical protein
MTSDDEQLIIDLTSALQKLVNARQRMNWDQRLAISEMLRDIADQIDLAYTKEAIDASCQP